MNDQTSTVLERLSDSIPVRPAPVDLLDSAQALRRRRRSGLVAAGAVACLALTIGVAALPNVVGDDPRTGHLTADRPLTPPPATQLVGAGKVAVAIPESWATGPMCGSDRGVAYYADPSGCAVDSNPKPTHLEILPGPMMFTDSTPTTIRTLDGYPVVANDATCETSDPSTCRQVFGIPDLEVYFVITVSGQGAELSQIDAIRDSMVILGDYQSAVPHLPLTPKQAEGPDAVERATAALGSAGFEVVVNETVCKDTGYCPLGVVDTTPAAGTVVRSGSPVTINVIR
ncbi:PASTA domain-containing protein [Nocardioides pacificus]